MIAGSVGGVAFLFIIIFLLCLINFCVKKSQTFENNRTKQEDHQYDYVHNVQGPWYRATGDVVATDNVTIIPNPSYGVVSRGVRLQDNPSYIKILAST